jgi:hypothetical protein
MSVPGPLPQLGDEIASQSPSIGHPDFDSPQPASHPDRRAPQAPVELQALAPQTCEHFAEQLAADVWMNDSAVTVVGIWPAKDDSCADTIPVIRMTEAIEAASRTTICQLDRLHERFHI